MLKNMNFYCEFFYKTAQTVDAAEKKVEPIHSETQNAQGQSYHVSSSLQKNHDEFY